MSGGVMLVYNCPVVWWSRRQHCVSLSSAEAEYLARLLDAKGRANSAPRGGVRFRTSVTPPLAGAFQPLGGPDPPLAGAFQPRDLEDRIERGLVVYELDLVARHPCEEYAPLCCILEFRHPRLQVCVPEEGS